MSKIIKKIVESSYAPEDKHVYWDNGELLLKYSKGYWVPVLCSKMCIINAPYKYQDQNAKEMQRLGEGIYPCYFKMNDSESSVFANIYIIKTKSGKLDGYISFTQGIESEFQLYKVFSSGRLLPYGGANLYTDEFD